MLGIEAFGDQMIYPIDIYLSSKYPTETASLAAICFGHRIYQMLPDLKGASLRRMNKVILSLNNDDIAYSILDPLPPVDCRPLVPTLHYKVYRLLTGAFVKWPYFEKLETRALFKPLG